MLSQNSDFYINAMREIHPDVHDIQRPVVAGLSSSVFFGQTAQGRFVYRFGHPDIIVHDYIISCELRRRNICAPNILLRSYQNKWFQIYPYCSGVTLYERILTGIAPAQVRQIYQDVIRVQGQISKINVSDLPNIATTHYYKIYGKNTKNSLPHPVSDIVTGWIYVLSRYNASRLYHNDLSPKNILVDDKDNFAGILDLEAVALANPHFSLIKLAHWYPLNDIEFLIDTYRKTMDIKLNEKFILQNTNAMRLAAQIRQKMFPRIK